jgi:hypothetical protein
MTVILTHRDRFTVDSCLDSPQMHTGHCFTSNEAPNGARSGRLSAASLSHVRVREAKISNKLKRYFLRG